MGYCCMVDGHVATILDFPSKTKTWFQWLQLTHELENILRRLPDGNQPLSISFIDTPQVT